MRTSENLKYWSFQKENGPWEQVTVPHDWAIGGPFDRSNDNQQTLIVQDGETEVTEHNGRTGGLPHVGKGVYRCEIAGPQAPGRQVFLVFDGVMSHAEVYLNGSLAGKRNYGYSSFRIEAAKWLHPGKNTLEVRAENLPESSRWYPGAGIYRRVQRIETDPIHFAHWGVRAQYLPETESLLLTAEIRNRTGHPTEARISIRSELFSPVEEISPIPDDKLIFRKVVPLLPHRKWSIDDPVLYAIEFKISSGTFSDEETFRFGIRNAVFDAEKGFFLNGKSVKLNGVCMHHDLGPLGAAFNRAAAKRQLELLRQMGCNAIRTSHNPPAPELLDLCDEMGFLVMDEAFDCWRRGKLKNDYHNYFDSDSETDLGDLVRRDCNHPSVILWSIGNEVKEIYTPDGDGPQIAQRLTDLVHSLDPSRPVSMGLNLNPEQLKTAMSIQEHVDIPGWNYQPQRYAFFKRHYQDKPMIGSETMSTVSSRGIYYFPAREYVYGSDAPRNTGELQCSSYALDTMPWATIPETEIIAQQESDFIAGQFIWTGFDYLGEPSPYNREWSARSSYFGCIDLVGLPKDLFFLMQSCWTAEPMVHIVPHHWNWNENDHLDLHVFSNCDAVELFLNGKSLGRKSRRPKSSELYRRIRFIWENVQWEPGTLKAVGFRGEEPCSEEILKTAGKPSVLKLETNRTECAADGDDMLFVTVSVTDRDSVFCATDRSFVKFRLEGDSLEIAAADAGNAASVEVFRTPECTLFSGMAVVYLRSTGKPGTSVLHAEGNGLRSASISLSANL